MALLLQLLLCHAARPVLPIVLLGGWLAGRGWWAVPGAVLCALCMGLAVRIDVAVGAVAACHLNVKSSASLWAMLLAQGVFMLACGNDAEAAN
jgi:hypothetical protein